MSADLEIVKNISPQTEADQATPPILSAIGPDFPDEWYGWPTAIELSFKLWAGLGVCRELYESYAAQTIEQAAARLFRERLETIWPVYRLRTPAPITPIYRVNLSRPLWRRTSDEYLEIRGQIPGPSGEPDDEIADDTLMQIWFEGHPTSWSKEWWAYWPPRRRRAMLMVAGRDAADAGRRWNQCAKVMRRIYRQATGWRRVN